MSKFLPPSGGPPKPRPRPVQPQPQPMHPTDDGYYPVAPAQSPARVVIAGMGMLALAIVFCFVVWMWTDRGRVDPRPNPEPRPSDGVSLGRDYAPDILKAWAKASKDYSEDIASGMAFADAEKKKQTTFRAGMERAFTREIVPVLTKIVKEGDEPKADDPKRKEWAELWAEIAEGVEKAAR